jgi:hypothetical protein
MPTRIITPEEAEKLGIGDVWVIEMPLRRPVRRLAKSPLPETAPTPADQDDPPTSDRDKG